MADDAPSSGTIWLQWFAIYVVPVVMVGLAAVPWFARDNNRWTLLFLVAGAAAGPFWVVSALRGRARQLESAVRGLKQDMTRKLPEIADETLGGIAVELDTLRRNLQGQLADANAMSEDQERSV